MRKLSLIVAALSFLSVGIAEAKTAPQYPTRPITAYIPLGAGDTSDIFIRTITPYMEKFLGQPVVLVNKPGSGGATAISALQTAKPDGYTMSWANLPTLVILPQMRKLVYDPKVFSYIAAPLEFEYILFAKKDSPYNSLKELLDAARKSPDSILYSAPGLGSTNHLGVAWLAQQENVQMRAVPFDGNPKALAAVLGGSVTVANSSTTAAVSAFQAGQIKPLAVMSNDRIALVPDTPTLKELGYNFSQYSCLGAVFPPGTPEDIRQRMEDAIRYAVEQPEVQKKITETLFARIIFRTGKEYKQLCEQYWDVWGNVLSMVNLKMK